MRGGCFLLDTATQTTRIPTQTTTTVAETGTIMSRSIHSGRPGKPVFVSAVFVLPPNGGARVPGGELTFRDVVVSTPEDADDDNGDDDDSKGGNHRNNEIEVGQEVHDPVLKLAAPSVCLAVTS